MPVYTVLCPLCSLSWELGSAAANGGACAWLVGQPGAAGAAQLPTPSLSCGHKVVYALRELGLS